MSTYCTYFDSAYATRGYALARSLRQSGDLRELVVLALDDVAREYVSRWDIPAVTCVTLVELEEHFPELLSVKTNRSRVEYIFTLTPWLIQFVLESASEGTWVTYLDADMYFFSSPEPVYQELGDSSVAIIEHRFTWDQSWRRRYGKFNVGWVGFRDTDVGRAALQWWASSCLEWCYDRVEGSRFADQGYLNHIAEAFSGVHVVRHPGANLAPWNIRQHRLGLTASPEVTVDNELLVFFHFHGLRQEGTRFFPKHLAYLAPTTSLAKDHIYRPYCSDLLSAPGIAVSPRQLQEGRLTRSGPFLQAAKRTAGRLMRSLGGSLVIDDS